MDADAIFDAFGKAARYVILCDRRSEKAEQLRGVQERRCGNCTHWMKSSCAPEKKRGQFKSCNSLACGDFTLSTVCGLIAKFTHELAEIDKRISTLREEAPDA